MTKNAKIEIIACISEAHMLAKNVLRHSQSMMLTAKQMQPSNLLQFEQEMDFNEGKIARRKPAVKPEKPLPLIRFVSDEVPTRKRPSPADPNDFFG